ncbi:MAG TPA: PfkB family carbohydrate kinase [Candidatus Acidoferrales bacterium]|nr:PfkB family carbohydrate kinase [Candidatus Acidoferrales bacterium]
MNPARKSSTVDVVGIGINATDTILRLPRFPASDSKIEILSAEVAPGGQVASAIVACQRWGLATRYVGKIGDDDAGKLQRREMERAGVDVHWIVAQSCSSQIAYILVDESSGERTVLWKRDSSIALRPSDLKRDFIFGARALLIDGHDTAAAAQAARWAREEHVPVVGDFDNLYPGVQDLLQYVDFPIASKDFPERLTGEASLLKSLPKISTQFKCRLTAATLGRLGVLGWDREQFILCPGYRVQAVDTTGAGDIFHGAFVFGLNRGWPVAKILEFSCAAAALNCTAPGARGRIASLDEIEHLRHSGNRSEPAYSDAELQQAARAAVTQGVRA